MYNVARFRRSSPSWCRGSGNSTQSALFHIPDKIPLHREGESAASFYRTCRPLPLVHMADSCTRSSLELPSLLDIGHPYMIPVNDLHDLTLSTSQQCEGSHVCEGFVCSCVPVHPLPVLFLKYIVN